MDLGHHFAILYLVLGCLVAGAQSTSALILSAALGAGSPSGMIARVDLGSATSRMTNED